MTRAVDPTPVMGLLLVTVSFAIMVFNDAQGPALVAIAAVSSVTFLVGVLTVILPAKEKTYE